MVCRNFLICHSYTTMANSRPGATDEYPWVTLPDYNNNNFCSGFNEHGQCTRGHYPILCFEGGQVVTLKLIKYRPGHINLTFFTDLTLGPNLWYSLSTIAHSLSWGRLHRRRRVKCVFVWTGPRVGVCVTDRGVWI